MEINNKQKLAIECLDNPMLIIAGAGSGKTFVLVERIVYLLKKYGYHSNSILAFTFTNKAANEMKRRISNLTNNNSFNWIGTFHSICLKILRRDIDHLGLTRDFLIIDEDEKLSLIKEIYTMNEYSKDIVSHKKMIQYISLLKNCGINFNNKNDILEYLIDLGYSDTKSLLMAEFYFKYMEECKKKNVLDFDDLIIYTIKLLKFSEEIRQKWQNNFSYILVDEFQDTSQFQFEIIKLLSKDSKNIFVVGDPDQMIYSWRCLSNDIFDDFRNYFPNYEQIILDQNYRSTKKILEVSNLLISNNKGRVEKNLFTNNIDGDNIIYYHGKSPDDETRWVIDKVKFLKSHGYNYSDILILYRSNYLSRNIEQALIGSSIPYAIFGGFRFFQRKEIKDIVAYLKLVIYDDDISFSRVYNVPKRKIGEASYAKLLKFAASNNLSIIAAIDRIDEISELNSAIKNKFKEFKKNIIDFRNFKYLYFNELVDKILTDIKYLEYLKEEDEQYREENIKEFKNAMNEFQSKNPNASLLNYLQEICLYTDASENKSGDDYVSLMTIHSAKGLEYKIVFIISFNDGDLPSVKSLEENNLNEERRIAYVAMTRAKEKLFISSSSGMSFVTGNLSNKLPSRFINEFASSKSLEQIKSTKNQNNFFFGNTIKPKFNSDEFLHEEDINFYIGEKIKHDDFGIGVILNIYKDMIDVAFSSPYGVKKLMKNHKKILKISN